MLDNKKSVEVGIDGFDEDSGMGLEVSGRSNWELGVAIEEICVRYANYFEEGSDTMKDFECILYCLAFY